MKLTFKLLIAVLIVLFIFGITIFFVAKNILSTTIFHDFTEMELGSAKRIAAASVPLILRNKVIDLQQMIDLQYETDEMLVYAFITDNTGKVLVHTFANGFPADLLKINDEIKIPTAPRGGVLSTIVGIFNVANTHGKKSESETHSSQATGYSQQRKEKIILLETEQGLIYDIAYPILEGRLGMLHFGLSDSFMKSHAIKRTKELAFFVILIVAISMFALIAGINKFLRPLDVLRKTVESIKAGNLRAKAHVRTGDELQELGEVINKTVAGLRLWRGKTKQKEGQLRKQSVALTHMLARVKESYQKLQELDKLKDEFLQSTSHELRTPLTSLKGFVELMKEGELGKLTKKQLDALTAISYDVDRLTNSISKILDTARIEAGTKLDYQKFDFNEFVRQISRPLAIAAKAKKIVFIFDLNPLPLIKADRHWISQVITNFIHNAVKYTSQGSITVKTLSVGKRIQFSIIDTGMGIKKEFVAMLFSKFFQVTHTTSGSGLGLYICKKIVELHKGEISVESTYGKGSMFSFTIPTNGERESFK